MLAQCYSLKYKMATSQSAIRLVHFMVKEKHVSLANTEPDTNYNHAAHSASRKKKKEPEYHISAQL